MKCKKVYDVIGHLNVNTKGYATVKGAILLPYATKDEKQERVSPQICNQINISSNGFNAYLLIIKCRKYSSSLRNEWVQDYFPFELTIKKEELDFKKGRKLRLIVIHDDKLCENPDSGIVECTRNYVAKAGYLEGWEFDDRKCDGWVVYHGPKRSGESVMVDM
ncbi:hypothetical protein [Maribacter sp. 2210JD10-5]|uniref:hypothetical protein n=1 Tax=Maribacter sp. 2210JD10-5 TaxID=3386272 RepID=UPI0039BD1DE2